MSTSSISVSKEFMQEFHGRNMAPENGESPPDSPPENGGPPIGGGSYDKVAEWGFNTVNKMLKRKHERLGIDEQEIPQIAELTAHVLRKNFPEQEHRSPEGMLCMVLGLAAADQYLIWEEVKPEIEARKSEPAAGGDDE